MWARSLQAAGENFEGRDEAMRDGLVPVTEASKAVSAKGELEAASELDPTAIARARLAQIASTMPAIKVPDDGRHAARTADLVDRAATAASAAATALGAAAASTEVAQLLPRQLPDAQVAGTPTWLRNAVAPPLIDDRPEIAIMIDDLGLNRRNTAALNSLPGPLTLAFLPYAGALEQQAQAARAAGHELMLHVPMEPIGADWPGPDALLSSQSPSEFLSRFRAQLRSFRGFVGVNNHMGSLLTTDRFKMDEVMTELKARGLLFIDSRTTSKTVAGAEAQRLGVPHADRDVFLDNEADLDAIRRQLAATERIARRRGVAIAIGHPHDLTIEALRGWLPTLEERGFALVPISTVVARESCAHGLLVATTCGRYVSAHNTIQ
jgi:polysaccharide deacetylase 2 family uncharacterized protein YibQ